MIREGATLIRGAGDLLDDLGIDRTAPPPAPPDLDDDERRVWDALSGGSLPDSVAREAGMSIPDAVTTLIQLELRGLIVSVGGRYERRHRPAAPIARGLSIERIVRRLRGGVREAGRGMTEPSRGTLRTTLPVDTQGGHPPGACMPKDFPKPRSSSSAPSRTIWPSSAACPRTRSLPMGATSQQLATFLTRNRSSLGDAPYPLLRRFLAQQHTLGYARATIARRVGAIKTFYRWAVSAGRVQSDPSLLLGRPKVINRLPTVLRRRRPTVSPRRPRDPRTTTPSSGRSPCAIEPSSSSCTAPGSASVRSRP